MDIEEEKGIISKHFSELGKKSILKRFGNWRSEKYNSIHKDNLRHWGRATKCENEECRGISKSYEWALKQGKVAGRDRRRYFQLCHQCHSLYDRRKIKIILDGII